MADEIEQRLSSSPQGDTDKAVLACLLRLRNEGKSLVEIAAGVRQATGMELAPAAIDRILRQVAGPAASDRGADPELFSGYMGGG